MYSSFLVNSKVSQQRKIACKVKIILILIFYYCTYDMRIKDSEQIGTYVFHELYVVFLDFRLMLFCFPFSKTLELCYISKFLCFIIRICSVFLRRHVIWPLFISDLRTFSYYTYCLEIRRPVNYRQENCCWNCNPSRIV